jgi:O-antigen/teichoic acid export membrane protein
LQPEAAPPSSGLRRRTGWAVADQALSSATNVVITVLAARTLDPRDFGAFSLAFAVYILALGISRGLVTEPLLSRPSAIEESWPETCSAVTGAVLQVAIGIAVAIAVIAVVAPQDVRHAVIVLAVLVPGLLVQDAWRYCFMAQGRPISALANDAVWAICQTIVIVPLAARHDLNLSTLLLAWGFGAAIAACIGGLQTRARPHLQAGHRWFRAHVDLGWRYTTEFLLANGVAQIGVISLGAIAGLTAVGAVNAIQTLFGPINIVYSGISLVLVPTGARLAHRSTELRRTMTKASMALGAFAAAWAAGAYFLPTRIGVALFGRSWPAADRLVLLTGLLVVAGGLAAGGIAGLRSLAAAKESLRVRALTLPLVLAAPIIGAIIGDARGYTVGLALAAAVSGAMFWFAFRRLIAQASPATEVGS